MPVEYDIEGDLLTMRFIGAYETSEVKARFLEALADPRTPRPVHLLVEVNRSTSLQSRVPEEIRGVAEYLGPHAERISGRCAVVADSDVLYGLSRMGSVYSERVGVEARVFRDTASALAWLRSPPAEPEDLSSATSGE